MKNQPSRKASRPMVYGKADDQCVWSRAGVIKTMNEVAVAFPGLFPEGSETGAETEASPAIWTDRAGFDAAAQKFVDDTSGEVTDKASFMVAFGKATSNCGSCHKAYRVKN